MCRCGWKGQRLSLMRLTEADPPLLLAAKRMVELRGSFHKGGPFSEQGMCPLICTRARSERIALFDKKKTHF